MNTSSVAVRYRLVGLIVLMAVFVSGCGYSRIGVQWPSISTVAVNDQAQIMVAYNERIDMIDPANGSLARLLNTEGEVRVDEQGNPRTWILNGQEFDNAQFFVDPIAIDEDTLVVPTYNGSLLEVELNSARPDTPLGIPVEGEILANPIVTDAYYYVAIKSGAIVAVNRDTLDLEWTFTVEEDIWAQPLLADGVLYFGAMDHMLYAVDIETGTAVWSEPADLEGAILSSPVLYNDHLYVGSLIHKLFKIDLNGQIVDEYQATNWIWSSPVVFDETLYFTDLNGSVFAVSTGSFELVWENKVGERGIRPAPLVTDEYVIVASRDGRVHWLSRADGTQIFEREIEGRPEILSELLLLEAGANSRVDEPLVVIASVDPGRLVAAYTLDEGRLAWVYARR